MKENNSQKNTFAHIRSDISWRFKLSSSTLSVYWIRTFRNKGDNYVGPQADDADHHFCVISFPVKRWLAYRCQAVLL